MRRMSRREWVRSTTKGATGFALAPLAAAVPIPLRAKYRLFENSETNYSDRAVRLVSESNVVDMLSPLTINFSEQETWFSDPESFDLADRFRSSGINVFHSAIGFGGHDAYEIALRYFASWNGFLAEQSDVFLRVDSVRDLARLKAGNRTGVILGVQNAEHFRTLDDVQTFWGMGQRVSQLTYNRRNRIGNGSTERSDGGLSDFGVGIVEKMNEVGMAVDVSHSGDQTTLDACAVSRQPVLFTHSNCRALANHPRCKTDEAIQAMAKRGGVMGITGVRMFVRDREPTTLEHVLDHFDHVRDLVGIEHVGLGSDVDLNGYDDLPADQLAKLKAGYKGNYAFREKIDIEGLDHPQRVFDLTEGLVRRGYTDAHIELVLGGNFERVLESIWSARKSKAG